MAAVTNAAEDCSVVVKPYVKQKQREEQGLLTILTLAVTLLMMGVAVGWRIRGELDRMKLTKVTTRTVQVHAQVKYTWWTETTTEDGMENSSSSTYEFQPLGNREHGAWQQ
jgi:hypothetical protein